MNVPTREGRRRAVDLAFPLPRPQPSLEPQCLPRLCPMSEAPPCPPGGAEATSTGSQAGPTLLARTIWNFRREGGWESGLHVPLSQPWPCSPDPATSATWDLFAPKPLLLLSTSSGPPSTGTLPRDAHSPAAEGAGFSLLTARTSYYPPLHPQPSLGFCVPFSSLFLCLRLSVSPRPPPPWLAPSGALGLKQGSMTHESGSPDVFSFHKSICKKSCLIGTRSSEVLMALKQDGFSLREQLLATGRGHGKFGFLLLQV